MLNLIQPKRHTLSLSQTNPHITPNTPQNCQLYPQCTHIHGEPLHKILHALPESRWYRQSNTLPNTVTIQDPNTTLNPTDIDENTPLTHIRLNTETFWNMITWHALTQSKEALPIQDYDARAHDIYMAAQSTENPSLCWATDRELLDIFIDVIGCTAEIFTNILNTYHRFTNRRSIQPYHAFPGANVSLDGTHPEAYKGIIYGNPPFDGAKQNTINKMLNLAEQAALGNEPFRGVFVLPLSPHRLEHRLKHRGATLLARFPDNTVPFIPYHYWQDNINKAKYYKQANTNIVILMYESANRQGLLPIDTHCLNARIASWFIRKSSPDAPRDRDTLSTIGIPMAYFHDACQAKFPQQWKIWDLPDSLPTDRRQPYPGSAYDFDTRNTPFWDLISLDRKAAALGLLPNSYRDFLRHVSANDRLTISQILFKTSKLLRNHTYQILRSYKNLTKPIDSTGRCQHPPGKHQQPDTTNRTVTKSVENTNPLSTLYPHLLCYDSSSDDDVCDTLCG